MDDTATYDWLMAHGGPIVRAQCAALARLGLGAQIGTVPEPESLEREVLAMPLVQAWLERLTVGRLAAPLEALDAASLGRLGGLVHGSRAACLENVLGKLAEFGLHAGMPALDARALPLMRIFRWRSAWKDDLVYQNAWEALVKSVLAWGLLRLGYTPDDAMRAFLREHMAVCHRIARDRVFDLYAGPEELVGLPKAWAGKPILKQDVMAHYWLPYIHDMYVFAHLPADLQDDATRGTLADLLAYVLDPRFQALPEGYGYAWIKTRHTCYGWGWSPHLPGFQGFDGLPDGPASRLVMRVELLAHLAEGRRSPWLRQALEHLEGFRTPLGTYRFPGHYLREAEGYYVHGYGMGLGEDRRRPLGMEVESTFRMLKIRALCGPGHAEGET